jgi:hypothetical protein
MLENATRHFKSNESGMKKLSVHSNSDITFREVLTPLHFKITFSIETYNSYEGIQFIS